MILKGKAREDFEKWYLKYWRANGFTIGLKPMVFFEDRLPFLMQYGVYEKWFNLNGLFPEVTDLREETSFEDVERFHSIVKSHEKYYPVDFHRLKIVAQKQILKTANELYNEKFLTIQN